MSRNSKKAKKIKAVSGAMGGPSTGRGMNYQIDFAIRQTLDYISRALCAPHKCWEVRIEPRVPSSDEPTSWDLGFEPDDLLFEVKLKPTRSDIDEWVKRVTVGGKSSSGTEFHLVYSKGAGVHLETLDRLIRIAREASGNLEVFASLTKAEGLREEDRFLSTLGNEPHLLLSRMKVEQAPEYLLEHDIEFRARQLAGEEGGKRLREFLFRKFHKAVPHRTKFAIGDLIEKAREQGIQFAPPPEVNPADLSLLARSALIILQACSAGIPTRVIAMALDSSEENIMSELEDLQKSHVVTLYQGLWSVKPLPSQLTSPDNTILSKALLSLLAFIDEDDDANMPTHVRNVIDLAQVCTSSDPILVASVFTRLDKRLKRIGNKRLVWFVAHLSIQAARMASRTREVIEFEARALICGTSWAFQRLHRLEKARVDAHLSQDLARNTRLDRTLAFCLKCLGRLCRMEAEALEPGELRESKLRESVALLQEAIDKFSTLAEFGPSHPEVGDCYSLLGRTYLELRQLSRAGDAIRKAYELITDQSSKDYIDLVILSGDFDVAKGDREAATRSYNKALEISVGPDPELSEMRARALLQRGTNEETQGHRTRAAADYQSAERIWRALEDHEHAARAAWKRICLHDNLSTVSLDLLKREPLRIRVEAVNIHNARLQKMGNRRSARRNEPPEGYWVQVINQARERVARISEW